MAIEHDEVRLLIEVDKVYRPGSAAKRFIWSDRFATLSHGGAFYESYKLDSEEHLLIDEVATYYEIIGLLWSKGVVGEELVMDWAPADVYWKLLGRILTRSRQVFDSPTLWGHFEALAEAQAGR